MHNNNDQDYSHQNMESQKFTQKKQLLKFRNLEKLATEKVLKLFEHKNLQQQKPKNITIAFTKLNKRIRIKTGFS